MDSNVISKDFRTVVLIPARYSSTRFPGKPLAKISNKEMIIWVAELSSKAVGKQNVYVVTDDERIKSVVELKGFNVIISDFNAITGTDRISEAAIKIKADIYINIQGDEPLLNPDDIKKVIEIKLNNFDKVINCYNEIINKDDINSINVPKVITNESNELIYISRLPIPGYKIKSNNIRYKKQVCIYAFNKHELNSFINFGRKSKIEEIEDIEILRFFELGHKILMHEIKNVSISVDTPEDLIKVQDYVKQKNNQ